jgi:hypothetical protein
VAKQPVGRPGQIGDLGDKLRLDPAHPGKNERRGSPGSRSRRRSSRSAYRHRFVRRDLTIERAKRRRSEFTAQLLNDEPHGDWRCRSHSSRRDSSKARRSASRRELAIREALWRLPARCAQLFNSSFTALAGE